MAAAEKKRGRGGRFLYGRASSSFEREREREKEGNKSLRFEGLMNFYYYSDSLLLTIKRENVNMKRKIK